MITVLDRIYLVVFTRGIGEHDAAVRQAVVNGFVWTGIRLDAASSEAHEHLIGDTSSRCRVLVLPSKKDEQIARHMARLVT
jgi:acetate kinase